MRTTGKKAFTLVELLIVIIIIGILATLAIPALYRARELAWQAACGAKVKVIIMGMRAYANASGERMPTVPTNSWNVAVGTNRTISPFAVNNSGTTPAVRPRNHSANMWLLARGGHVALSDFVCPESTDTPSTHQNVGDYWDFSSGLYVSYGMQSPYGFGGSLSVIMDKDVVLVADGSPYTQASGIIKTGQNLTIVDWGEGDGTDFANEMRRGNTPNHAGRGQNVGFWGGVVLWNTSAACGKDGDNIYTARNQRVREDEADAKTSAGLKGGGGSLANGIRNNPNDTLILP